MLSMCVCALIVPWCRPVEECGAAACQPVSQVYDNKGGGANRRKATPLVASHVMPKKELKASEKHLRLLCGLLPTRECGKHRVAHKE